MVECRALGTRIWEDLIVRAMSCQDCYGILRPKYVRLSHHPIVIPIYQY